MSAQFGRCARRVMCLADEEARRLHSEYLGTDHVLLALVRLEGGLAARVLCNLEVDLRRLRLAVLKSALSTPHRDVQGRLPSTPGLRRALGEAVEVAARLGHAEVGTGHMLLGLLQDSGCEAWQALLELEVGPEGEPLADLMVAVTAEMKVAPDPDEGPELAAARTAIVTKPGIGGPETVRAADSQGGAGNDSPSFRDSASPGASLGRAVLTALATALLVGAILCLLFWDEPRLGGPGGVFVLAGGLGLWVLTTVLAHLRWRRLPPQAADRPLPHGYARHAALTAGLAAVPVCLLLLAVTGPFGLTRALVAVCLLLGVSVGSAALVGFTEGMEVEENRQRQRQAGPSPLDVPWLELLLVRWDAGTLTERRQAVQSTIEGRFGPLGEGARRQVQGWDQERVVEVVERMPRASSLGELGLEGE